MTSCGRPVLDLRPRRGRLGGDRGRSEKVELPDRTPDADTTYDVSPQQALLYRLCGDRNPLHADPDFAKAAGFPAPILHGLCSYGIVLRLLTDELFGGDATRVGGFTARFAGVVFPGETIRVRAWQEDGRRRLGHDRRRGRTGRCSGPGRLRADLDVDVVVLLEERDQLLVGRLPAPLGDLHQPLEVGLPRRSGSEQDQQ